MLPSEPKAEPTPSPPAFRRVGENLYRHASSGTYYALVKRGGKQFRNCITVTGGEKGTKNEVLPNDDNLDSPVEAGGLLSSA